MSQESYDAKRIIYCTRYSLFVGLLGFNVSEWSLCWKILSKQSDREIGDSIESALEIWCHTFMLLAIFLDDNLLIFQPQYFVFLSFHGCVDNTWVANCNCSAQTLLSFPSWSLLPLGLRKFGITTFACWGYVAIWSLALFSLVLKYN